MNMRLPVGADIFEDVRKQGCYYVDKTGFIKNLLENRATVNLFTRPRRFGKTLNMTMLKAFFEIEADSRAIFNGLDIMKEPDVCARFMNRHPVIFLSMKSVVGKSFADALARVASLISFECDRFSFLTESKQATSRDKQILGGLLARSAPKDQLEDSLKFLSRMLWKHYGEKAVLLVDEYDAPLDKAFANGYYDEMVDFMRVFFGEALKTNDTLEFAVVTGCLRIAKESIFTGVNNLAVNAITDSDPDYDEGFGFTDKEVRKMLVDYNLLFAYDELRDWYNGYVFGNASIYCPWDIVSHVAKLKKNPEAKPKAYWNNTSANDLVRRFVDKADATTRMDIESLIAGGPVLKHVNDTLTYGELDRSIDNLWSVLFLTGYLTKTRTPADLPSEPVELVVPNLEVREIFMEKIRDWFSEKINTVKTQEELKRLYRAFLDGDGETIENVLQNQLSATISYFDNYENYYHGFLTGLLLGCGDWSVKSNRESGGGRSDLLVAACGEQTGLVVEVKRAEAKANMPAMCEAALKQAEENDYKDAFLASGVKHVRLYGIAFWKKTCMVKTNSSTMAIV